MEMQSSTPWGRIALGAALSLAALAACSQKTKDEAAAAGDNIAAAAGEATSVAGNAARDAGNSAMSAADNAATIVKGAVNGAIAAANTDPLSGPPLASLTGDAKKGELVFVACKICHAPDKNQIGPMLKDIVGRKAGAVAGYSYSDANKNSGITWSREKLFQYLEAPQRVVPGTKMAYPGLHDPQQRADLIAYLATLK